MAAVRVFRRLVFALCLLLCCAWLTGCGGGSTATSAGGPLTIETQPVSLAVEDGQAVSFLVTASGKQPLAYQWKRDNVPLSGATAATLSIPKAIYNYNNGDTYSVVVTDASGSQLTSQTATLTVRPITPVITELPLSQTVSGNSAATFAVAAHGSTPLSYQWNRNGTPIAGATAPSYSTDVNSYAQNSGDVYSVTVTNGAGQTTTSAPAVLTVATTTLVPTINVYATERDAAVAHQVNYRRGVVEGFDIGASSSTIVGNVTHDVSSAGLNFLNATLDLNSSADAGLFTYTAPNLTPSVSGSAPLMQTFEALNSAISPNAMQTAVQISGTPKAYSSNLDPGYEAACSATGNFYPLPSPGAPMQAAQSAIKSWIGSMNGSFPNAIWIGTQEPSHTLGYSTSYNSGNCANVPSTDRDAVTLNNIQRFIAYWTPIAQYLRSNHIPSGGIQLNAGNSDFYGSTAAQIIAAKMPLDYFTIQNYTPSPRVNQALYSAYEAFQQNPGYLGVKVILDRYGLSLANPNAAYGTAEGMISFLQDESLLMPYADMMYGYAVETSGVQGASGSTLLPQVLNWLAAAPVPLRPLTSTTSDLQAFALVQNNAPQRAYVAIWNISPTSTPYDNVSLVLNGLSASFNASNLTILKGSGTSITKISNSGVTVSGNTIRGLSLNVNEFALVSLQ